MQTITWTFTGQDPQLQRSSLRYAWLERLHRIVGTRHATLVAFALGARELRAVLQASPSQAHAVARAMQSGTLRSQAAKDAQIAWLDPEVGLIEAADKALAWCYAALDSEPLETPWSSARDLEGLRHAPFFDADDARKALGLPALRPAPADDAPSHAPEPDLKALLRIAGAVCGLPSHDPRCFPLFSQLARDTGVSVDHNAKALHVTPRRIYQLRQSPSPLLAAAHRYLYDPKLEALP